ncbi:methyltransferase domain-containing protein [Synechococcales cyanobacterium C]|uniref:Methyltransferase domain-containing protein n=1 Tax=Petrachloros mirabilis ULC683 TaxID=2781853 RepID=A0A8K1ZWM5_9CYAN|nr:class I SAM-dependent methyltransferase [Petrachloros mirabilis]NCJ06243.1 methyltransferase domain-containing protein [Petrachloros mirabilis ULC683]
MELPQAQQTSVPQIAVFIERCTCINCGGDNLIELSAGRFDEGAVQRFIAEDPWGENPAPFLKGKPWSYVACQNCGQAFHRYILDPEWNERRFSKWMTQEAIEVFEKSIKTPEREFQKATVFTTHVLKIEQLTRAIRGGQAPRVLDFGCGYGGFLSMCSMYGFEAYGVDRAAAKRDHGVYDKIFAEIGDVIDKAPFHALTLFEVLEHLDEPYNLMVELGALLVTGGILVLETPNCTGIHSIKTQSDYRKIHPLDHINGFTPKTLKCFAQRLGFEPVSPPISYVTCNPKKIVKSLAKSLLSPVMKPTTQLYFRKL